jgi:spore germination cell wall hydrolase CwlJ-like protein
MHQKSLDVLRRSDRVFSAALTVMLVAASAAVGAAATYNPHTEQHRTTVKVAPPAATATAGQQVAATPVSAPPARSATEQLVMNKLLAEHRCLSEALYYEARGEGTSGQKAIAEVIFHRMRTGNYGHSICAVVYEGANRPGCQFSFACNGDLAERKSASAWMRAQVLAARILTGEERLNDATGGATNFHAVSVDPDWAVDMTPTAQIGNHIFYKGASRSRPL